MVLSVASNHNPRWISYQLRESEPELQYLPTILSMWIVDNLFEELDLPNPPNPSSDERHFEDQCGRKWITRMLNFINQQVLEQDMDGTQLAAIGANEHESVLFEGTPRIRCRSKYRGAARKVVFITHFYTLLHISCVLVTHYSMFYYTLLHIFTQCHAASRTVFFTLNMYSAGRR